MKHKEREMKGCGKKITESGEWLVLGLGASGLAAARLLLAEGRCVTVLESGDSAALRACAEMLRAEGARVALGWSCPLNGVFDIAVVSPGVPPKSELFRTVEACGIPLISELELGWSRLRAPVLAVTGSNGKSTAVKWLSEILLDAGKTVVIGGNYGRPVSDIAMEKTDFDWILLEVSSFQLATVREFRPDIGILLNMLPNHLDWHGDMSAYRDAKMRLFENIFPDDLCILPFEMVSKTGVRQKLLSTFGVSADADWQFKDGAVWKNEGGVAHLAVNLRGSYFDNEIFGVSAAAITAAVKACGVDSRHIENAARLFEPLPHRMQRVAEIDGVVFVNDSKATNLAALEAALRMTGSSLRLIAGGRAKESDFVAVCEALSGVRAVYLIGEAMDAMSRAWSEVINCIDCTTLSVAVERAWNDAVRGETILLAPGCASFDQFVSFEERGDFFIQLIKNLQKKNNCEIN